MSAKGVGGPSLDARSVEVERLLDSAVMRGSESLCRLLRYLANRAIQDAGTPIREHEIAAEVFGRDGSFDPRIDSTVRVNIARLRAKLIEYYSHSGADDPITIELPKGSYTLTFCPRRAQPAPVSEPKLDVRAVMETPAIRVETPRPNRVLALALACMTCISAILAATLLLDRNPRHESRAVSDGGDMTSLRRFWGTLLPGANDPLVVFSNATFVGKPVTGLRYFVPSRDASREVVDFYTGVGEVLSVHALDKTFALLGRSVRVKRGALLSLDDIENSDVIFVGSSLENLPLRDVPGLRDFQFRIMDSGPRSGQGALVNLAPGEGEPKMFLPSSLPLSEDYAVIGLVPGLNPSRWALILAGTSTIGTQGAVEYVCREDTLRDLLEFAGKGKPGSLPRFEAVLDVHIKGGVPVQSKIVSFHKR